MSAPEPKTILVKRPGTTDLAFTGWLLARDTAGWPEVRLYKSQSGKYVIDERDFDEAAGEQLPARVTLYDDLNELVNYVQATFGEYSDEAKSLFRQASSIEPKLLRYAVEEV